MPVITLTTDFGDPSLYPAAMKAVIFGLNPEVQIVDLTHSVPRAGIREGAFALYFLTPYFPPQTVHVAVIDPGVGTSRRPLAIKAGSFGKEQFFVGPDNGLLIPAARRIGAGLMEVYEITNRALMLPGISSTFHGRDIFAPVGANLSKGFPVEKVGPKISDFTDLDFGNFGIDGKFIFGEVLFVDSFGNVITNIPGEVVLELSGFGAELEVNGRPLPFVRTYGLVESGETLALIGSHGFLEFAVNLGDAAQDLGLKNGAQVKIKGLS
ncbi:MAG: S-adenosyl-l-methionine hydroxide adenosyltransferase family protein [Methanosarcinaceae archaeon]|nr:S-adenosyl-l-methionine hydroxide adenosyltransferase family protein [Methanosarcinaceae archaeon]MDD4498636.1 S-adenosyl-l-methionine hydroxide adenosyltransferase family protein [Methanosarcinaceae archaeon]